MTIWFISDTHFGHSNIIKYCNRPFNTIEDMNNCLIDNINKTVKKEDVLYHLGDFCFGDAEQYRTRLKCDNIHIILGNHDPRQKSKRFEKFKNLFSSVSTYKELIIDDMHIVLHHYPLNNLNIKLKLKENSIYLHGHCHNKSAYKHNTILHKDLSVEGINYAPVTLKDILCSI